jgi:UPF0755 protein
MKKFFLSFFITIAILVIVCGAAYFWYQKNAIVRAGKFEIFQGASVSDISSVLEKSKIVPNGDLFLYYVKFKNLYYSQVKKQPAKFVVAFKHGKYKVKSGDFDSLIKLLNNGSKEGAIVNNITIPEGTTVQEMGEIFEKDNLFPKETFYSVANDKTYYLNLRRKYPWMSSLLKGRNVLFEGYLRADTYQFPMGVSPQSVIETMLSATNEWYVNNSSLIKQSGYTFDQILTLSSVVERESKFKQDRPKVAQVFLNRLKRKIKLESDITAAYAMGQHKVFMTNKDIKIKSPYNTYYVKALPIGPIAAPSEDSLKGVLVPAGVKFNYLYFYARPNGQTFYAKTWNQHEIYRKRYEREWLAINAKN